MKRADKHDFKVSLFDGLGCAWVYVVDGYGCQVTPMQWMIGVHNGSEAIAAFRQEFPQEAALV